VETQGKSSVAHRGIATGGSTWRRAHRRLDRLVDWLASRRRRVFVYTLVVAISFVANAVIESATYITIPRFQDEFSYLLAGETYAQGRLTNPAPALWRHFETFHVMLQPTYMSKYPPLQGMILAVGIRLLDEPMVGVWISVSIMCLAISWMLFQFLAPRWAVLGSTLLLVNIGTTTYWSHSYWGGAAAATGGALLFGSLQRLRKNPGVSAATGYALALSILANSRPFEGAILSIIPTGYAAWHLARDRGLNLTAKLLRVILPASLVLGVIAGLMLYNNWRVTGRALELPYQCYMEQYDVLPLTYFQPLRSPPPKYDNEHIKNFHTTYQIKTYFPQPFTLFDFVRLTWSQKIIEFAKYFGANLTGSAYLTPLLLVVPFLTFRWRALRVMLAALLVLLVAHLITIFYQIHYDAAALPIWYLLYLFAVQRVKHLVRPSRNARILFNIGVMVVVALMVTNAVRFVADRYDLSGQLTGASPAVAGTLTPTEIRPYFEQVIERDFPGKHVIIVHAAPYHNMNWELVYNSPDIDQQSVIWARDMGAANADLIRHYPDRTIWLLETEHMPMILLHSAATEPAIPTTAK
jgi:hypothetical protein